MRVRIGVPAVLVVNVLLLGASPAAAELKPKTLAAFERYVRLTEGRQAGELNGTAPFLWVDRQPPAEIPLALDRLRRGDVLVARLETRDGGAPVRIDDGLIHHWVATVLLPAPVDQVIALVQDYNRYGEYFAPTVQRSRTVSHDGNHFDVTMRTSMKKVITVVLDQDYAIDYRRISPARVFARSVTTNTREVQSAGAPDERSRNADEGTGFLWRLHTYCAFEQRPEGTYEQCESISLTRDVPFALGWIVKPFVTGIPRETLETTLGKVRTALAKPN